jgi:hypothetical protein
MQDGQEPKIITQATQQRPVMQSKIITGQGQRQM